MAVNREFEKNHIVSHFEEYSTVPIMRADLKWNKVEIVTAHVDRNI